MPVILSGLFSLVGSVFSSLFNFKNEQAKTVQEALGVLTSIDDNDSKSTVALASALSAILTSGSFLERNWRAVLMSACVLIILSSYFGFTPSHFNDPVTPTMAWIYHLVEIGLGGYIVKGGVVEVMKNLNISSILKELIKKKLV